MALHYKKWKQVHICKLMLFSQQAILYGGTGPAMFPQPG